MDESKVDKPDEFDRQLPLPLPDTDVVDVVSPRWAWVAPRIKRKVTYLDECAG